MGRHDENGSENQEGAVSFETYRDEAFHFLHVQQYLRAIESFTKALDLKPDDQNCLVTRSRCHLLVGNADASLNDAEMALKENDKLIKGFFQKAEALYQKGDFESALMFYHKGHRLRPELQEFRLGIQKSREAINNSIGTPDSVKLEANKGDMSYFYKQEEELEKQQQKEKKEREKEKKDKSDQQEVSARTKNAKKQQKGSYQKPTAKKEERKEREAPKGTADAKTVKQLLGELYGDKEYLEKLLKDQSLTGNTRGNCMSGAIKDDCIEGLVYLHTRADFWRQQKPMYARKRDRDRQRESWNKSKKGGKGSMDAVLRNLEEIDEAQSEGRYQDSLELARKTLKIVEADNNDEIQNREELRASLNSSIGNAYLELGKLNQALEFHNRDLDIARENNLEDAKSRALDNLGRVYARKGEFERAIEVWQEKIPASKSPLESTWLYHEIGRCYLEVGKYSDARDYGEKSLMAAREADDCGWQLHASVLVAQSEVKLGDYQAAADSFEKSLELARRQNDDAAEQAISKALEEVNEKIVKGVKDGEADEEEQVKKAKTPSPSPPPPPPPKEPTPEPSPEPERELTPPRKKSVSIREDVQEDNADDKSESDDKQDSVRNSPKPQIDVDQQQQQQQWNDSTDDEQQRQQPQQVSDSEQTTGGDTGESARDKSPEPQQQQQQQQQQEEQGSEKGSTGGKDTQQRES